MTLRKAVLVGVTGWLLFCLFLPFAQAKDATDWKIPPAVIDGQAKDITQKQRPTYQQQQHTRQNTFKGSVNLKDILSDDPHTWDDPKTKLDSYLPHTVSPNIVQPSEHKSFFSSAFTWIKHNIVIPAVHVTITVGNALKTGIIWTYEHGISLAKTVSHTLAQALSSTPFFRQLL